MKITNIRIAGFRGIKDELNISIPPGYLIITGKNGSGKSTICDALEYALRGDIRALPGHKEKGESLHDYLWWRGKGSKQKSVSIGIQDERGEIFEFTRTPSSGNPSKEICDLLTANSDHVDEFLSQLCRTSIIRGEEITQLSLDMVETKRFDMVQTALGTSGLTEIETKAGEVFNIVKGQFEKANQDYQKSRNLIESIIENISEAKVKVSGVQYLEDAKTTIIEFLPSSVTDEELLSKAMEEISHKRLLVVSLEENLEQIIALQEDELYFISDQYKSEINTIQETINIKTNEISEIILRISELDRTMEEYQKVKPKFTSLANLYDHGRKYGLEKGDCPLCGSQISREGFDLNLDHIEEVLSEESVILSNLASNRNSLLTKKENFKQEKGELKERFDKLIQKSRSFEEKVEKIKNDMILNNINIKMNGELAPNDISSVIEQKNKEIRLLTNAVRTIEASIAEEKVRELEYDLQSERDNNEILEISMRKLEEAMNTAKTGFDTIRRLIKEDLDERLAELSPLIEEIYTRMKPHDDWRHLKTHIRGDLKKFLSFDVGDGVNPTYIFSSGQKRIAGLAFLLAVHLSRWWCKLDTLILDDPVQHIDDFRALHLVETLSSIRLSGRQVICTIEDPDLADVLCRRLRSSATETGLLVKLEYHQNKGVQIIEQTEILPIHKNVLIYT